MYGDEDEDDESYEVRALLDTWLSDTHPEDDDPLAGVTTGLDVPEGTAAEVTDALTGLLGLTAPAVAAAPPPEALLIARVLVVDEHPSAGSWSEEERRTVTGLVAVLLTRHGEEGVAALVRALRRKG